MSDRDNTHETHEDAVNGDAGAQGAAGLVGARGTDDVDTVDDEALDGESLDSETAALLGASLRPVAPPAAIRSALLEAIAGEPQDRVNGAAGTGDSADHSAGHEAGRSADHSAGHEAGRSADHSAGHGAGRSADRRAGHGAGHSAGHSAGGSDGAADGHGGDAAQASVVSLDARRRRRAAWRTGLVRAAAAVVLLGVGVGVGRWSARGAVDEAMDSMAPTQHYAHLNQAQDVQRVTDTMPDGHVATLTWSRDMSMTALTLPTAMKDSAGDRSLQVWLKEGDETTSLGVYDPRDGAGFSFLDVMPEPGQQIVITLEPAGGSARPTTPPLVTLRVGEDSGQSGTPTGSPAPEPSTGPTGDSA